MSSKTYTVQFKTGDAEIRALKNISKDVYANANFRLLVELTRGRKSKKDKIGDLHKRIKSLKDFLHPDTTIFLDVTADENLANEQIDDLFDINNGYKKWRDFIRDFYIDFKNVIPMIMYNDLDGDYINFVKQVSKISSKYKKVGYKIYPSIDIEVVKTELNILRANVTSDTYIYVFYDHGYIIEGLCDIASDRAVSYLGIASAIFDERDKVEFILASTSFPDSVTTLSGKEKGCIKCAEILLYNQVQSGVENINISYADYASITPKRNDDGAFFGNGWTPRIDVPIDDLPHIYYQRRKKGYDDYADVYVKVAEEVVASREFPSGLSCWGCDTINSTASGFKPGATPSFWMSVRMNIFIHQQLKRLSII